MVQDLRNIVGVGVSYEGIEDNVCEKQAWNPLIVIKGGRSYHWRSKGGGCDKDPPRLRNPGSITGLIANLGC